MGKLQENIEAVIACTTAWDLPLGVSRHQVLVACFFLSLLVAGVWGPSPKKDPERGVLMMLRLTAAGLSQLLASGWLDFFPAISTLSLIAVFTLAMVRAARVDRRMEATASWADREDFFLAVDPKADETGPCGRLAQKVQSFLPACLAAKPASPSPSPSPSAARPGG